MAHDSRDSKSLRLYTLSIEHEKRLQKNSVDYSRLMISGQTNRMYLHNTNNRYFISYWPVLLINTELGISNNQHNLWFKDCLEIEHFSNKGVSFPIKISNKAPERVVQHDSCFYWIRLFWPTSHISLVEVSFSRLR